MEEKIVQEENTVQEEKKKSSKWIILLAFLLLIAVCCSFSGLYESLRSYLPDDSGAISLLRGTDSLSSAISKVDQAELEDMLADHPGFMAYDDEGVWYQNTEVSIFKVTYENGEGVFSTSSGNGDKIIAPGTENSYTFKLKNTGDCSLDYSLDIDAYVTTPDETLVIPVESRINRYDGKWIAGGQDEWVDVDTLDKTKDYFVLAEGRYTSYTLDWRWLYEGNDELDTLLGNLSVDEEVTLTIEIKTVATMSEDPDGGGGMTPSTGDSTDIGLYAGLGICSLALLVILFLFKEDKDEEKNKKKV